MSQPKLYRPAFEPGRGSNFNGFEVSMREDSTGEWVSFSDYAALAAEVERLRDDLNKWRGERRRLLCVERFARILVFFLTSRKHDNFNDSPYIHDGVGAVNEALFGRYPEGENSDGYNSGFHQNLAIRHQQHIQMEGGAR